MEKPTILKQPVMFRVLYALIPVFCVSIYYFGWRVAALVFVSCLFAFLVEWVMSFKRKARVTSACFVTAVLYGLSLPPTVPFWIAIAGVIIAILFGKEVFGGFGKNVFNPAIVGRAFVYICFPVEMTSKFVPVFTGFPGGFTKWDFTSTMDYPQHLISNGFTIPNAVSSATPLFVIKQFHFMTDWINLMVGNIGQTFHTSENEYILSAGSCGEVCSLAIIISVIYLLYTKTINYRLFLGTILGAIVATFMFIGFSNAKYLFSSILFTLFSGGLLYAAVFMVTEPITAPKSKVFQWVYACFIGIMIVIFRFKAVFAEGVAFSILLGNMLSPSFDLWYRKNKQIKGKKI